MNAILDARSSPNNQQLTNLSTPHERPKAYSYLRFSTPEQIQGDSHRRQTRQAQEYAARNNLNLDTTLTFEDLGVSAFHGRNAAEGGLSLFRRAVEDGLVARGSYLLVESLDRISRQSARKASQLLGEICDLGITVVTLTDGKAYTSAALDEDPLAFLMAILVFTRANEESRMKAHRLSSAWETKRQQVASGNAPVYTRRCPYWLSVNADSSGFDIIPDRAEVVHRIFEMALEGHGKHSIAERLNREGVKPFGRGKIWHQTYVAKILSNPAAYGTLQTHKTRMENHRRIKERNVTVEGYYPAVIDKATFDRVQSLKRSANPRRGRHAGNAVKNIFGGLATCPDCGGTVTRVSKDESKGWVYLVCQNAKMGAGCEYNAVRYDVVEPAFLNGVEHMLAMCPSGESAIDEAEENLRVQLDAIDDHIHRLLDVAIHAEGITDSPSLVQRLHDLEESKRETTEQLYGIWSKQSERSGPQITKRIERLSHSLKEATLNRLSINTHLRELFSMVVVNHHTGNLEFHWRQGGISEIIYRFPGS